MSLTVKAYLTKAGSSSPPEIRRFGIDADVSTNYTYFQSKINSVFPGLANKTYTLAWKDSENDTIVFSSDDELTEALSSAVNDGIFKVYIDERSDVPRLAPESGGTYRDHSSGVVHHGVTCDGCESRPLRGTRYKCKVCPDYDLCEECKSTGLHSEHSMRVIETPHLSWIPRHDVFFEGLPPFAGHFPDPPAYAPPVPPTIPHPPPPPMYPHFPMMPEIPGAMDPVTMRAQRRVWRRWYRDTFGEDIEKKQRKAEKRGKRDEKRKAKKEKKQKERDGGEEGVNGEGEGEAKKGDKEEEERKNSTSSSSSSSDEAETSNTESYLHNVGQSVAAMLDPLGIEVEIDVEHNGERRRCRKPGGGGACGGGAWRYRRQFGGGCRMPGNSGNGWEGFRRGNGCPWRFGAAGNGYGMYQEQSQGMKNDRNSEAGRATGIAAELGNPQAPGNFQASETNDSGEGRSQKVAEGAQKNPESGEIASGWTFVQASGDKPSAEVEEVAHGVENLHVSLPVTAEPTNTGANISSAVVEALTTMKETLGFTDENGWLTALLVQTNGDISMALDKMSAKK